MRNACLLAAWLAMGGAAEAACPVPDGSGVRLAAAAAQLAAGHAVSVVAGGPLGLGDCPGTPGEGRIAAAPNVTLDLADVPPVLELVSEGACDTVLLVADAGGWHFDDDGAGGEDARLALTAPEGRLDVWVGSFGPGSCRARLVVTAR